MLSRQRLVLRRLYNTATVTEAVETRRRRLLLNSRNRGRVETELFFGGFLSQKIWNMQHPELDELEVILDEADIDLFNWISGTQPMPDKLKNLNVMKQILAYVDSKSPSKKTSAYTNFNSDYDAAPTEPKQ